MTEGFLIDDFLRRPVKPLRPCLDKYVMDQLPGVAARSHDIHTKTGCKIVGPGGETRSEGYNGFCRGLDDEGHPERLERPEKYFWMEHAERNAIYNFVRQFLAGCTIYVSWLPCMDCARAIVQSGIGRVVVDKVTHSKNWSPKWEEDFKRVILLFKEAGVKLDWYEETK
jgi:dCMP deaminase